MSVTAPRLEQKTKKFTRSYTVPSRNVSPLICSVWILTLLCGFLLRLAKLITLFANFRLQDNFVSLLRLNIFRSRFVGFLNILPLGIWFLLIINYFNQEIIIFLSLSHRYRRRRNMFYSPISSC